MGGWRSRRRRRCRLLGTFRSVALEATCAARARGVRSVAALGRSVATLGQSVSTRGRSVTTRTAQRCYTERGALLRGGRNIAARRRSVAACRVRTCASSAQRCDAGECARAARRRPRGVYGIPRGVWRKPRGGGRGQVETETDDTSLRTFRSMQAVVSFGFDLTPSCSTSATSAPPFRPTPRRARTASTQTAWGQRSLP